MTSTTAPSTDEILAALARDPRYTDPDAVAQVKDLVLLLPGVIGEGRLDQKVTLKEFLNVEAEFLKAVLDTDFDKDFDDLGLTRSLFGGLTGQLESIAGNLDEFLAQMGMTEDQAMEADSAGLNDELKELYRAGTLTFADMVRIQPSVFLPQPS